MCYWFSHSEAQEVNSNISYFLSSGSLLITDVNRGNCKLKWEKSAFFFLGFYTNALRLVNQQIEVFSTP